MKGLRELFSQKTDEKTGEKCLDEAVGVWRPFGGATTLAEADAFETGQEIEREIDQLNYQLTAVLNNVMSSTDMTIDQKIAAMQAALVEAGAAIPKISDELGAEKQAVPPVAAGVSSVVASSMAAAGDGAETVSVVTAGDGLVGGFKGLDGQPRWIAIWTNRYEDKAHEVFREKAHEDYLSAIDGGYPLPKLDLWHVPGADLGTAEVVDYHDGFMFAVGTYDRPEYAERLKALGPLKCSHRFRYKSTDRDPSGTFWRYRTDRITVLPAGAEANGLTGFDPGNTEEPMRQQVKETLVRVLGAEKAAELESNLATLREEAEKQGVGWKELASGVLEPPEQPPAAPEPITLDAIKSAFAEQIGPIAAKVDALAADQAATNGQVADLVATKGQSAGFAPRQVPPGAAASTSDSTVVADGSPLAAVVKEAEKSAESTAEIPAHLKGQFALMNGNRPIEAVTR